jgi:hypothetical protein
LISIADSFAYVEVFRPLGGFMSRVLWLPQSSAIVFVLLSFFLTSVFEAISFSAEPENTHLQGNSKMFIKPVTGDTAVLLLTTSNGAWFKVTQRVGRAIKVEIDGSQAAIIPLVTDGQVSLVVHTISRPSSQVRAFYNTPGPHSFTLSGNRAVLTVLGVQFSVELIGLMKNQGPGGTFAPEDFGPDLDVIECCVICNGIRFCACKVTASCGNCCVGDCCG